MHSVNTLAQIVSELHASSLQFPKYTQTQKLAVAARALVNSTAESYSPKDVMDLLNDRHKLLAGFFTSVYYAQTGDDAPMLTHPYGGWGATISDGQRGVTLKGGQQRFALISGSAQANATVTIGAQIGAIIIGDAQENAVVKHRAQSRAHIGGNAQAGAYIDYGQSVQRQARITDFAQRDAKISCSQDYAIITGHAQRGARITSVYGQVIAGEAQAEATIGRMMHTRLYDNAQSGANYTGHPTHFDKNEDYRLCGIALPSREGFLARRDDVPSVAKMRATPKA